MDGYKRRIIQLVKENSVLWDPTHADYKSRDVRRDTWNEIEAQVPQIRGEKKRAKETWDDLMKGFSNAIRRSHKRGNNSSDKEWRFENDMAFLLSAKKHRLTASGFPEFLESNQDGDNGDSSSDQIFLKTEPGQPHDSEDEDDPFKTIHLPQLSDDSSAFLQLQKSQQEMLKEKSSLKRKLTCDCGCGVNKMTVDAHDESPRLNFFRSLMPNIASLDDDQFLNLQLEVIQAVQRVKNKVQ